MSHEEVDPKGTLEEVFESAPTGDFAVEIHDTDEGPRIIAVKDHFTLPLRTSTVRYRDKQGAARIISAADSQFILEETVNAETKKHEVEIRRIHDTSEGVRFLRIMYTLVTAFWTGFLFVFCMQILLFTVLDLAIEAGVTNKGNAHVGNAVGVVLAFPMLVYGLASALVIAGAFISDTYNGHFLIRNFALRSIDPVVVEWLFFLFFLGFPIFIMCCTLLSGSDEWWEVTLMVWLFSVFSFFVIFCANVLVYEQKACWEVCRNRYHDNDASLLNVLHRCILLRQVSTYGGRKTVNYLSFGSIEDCEYTEGKQDSLRNMVASTLEERLSVYTKLTLNPKVRQGTGWGLFEAWEPGKEERIYTVDDARDVRPFVTKETWSLEKIFCRKKDSRYIAIVHGPGALTEPEIKSSILCSAIGSFLLVFFFFATLIYLGMGIPFTMFIVAVGLCFFYPTFKSSYRLYKFGSDMNFARDQFQPGNEEGEVSQAVYMVDEVYRISKPTELFCGIMFVVEVGLFFIYPLISLISIANYPLALIFLIVAGMSFCRYYVNAVLVLEETGHMNVVDGQNEEEIWKNQSRMSEIIGNITRGRSRGAWVAVLGTIGFVFLALFLGAVSSDVDTLATFDIPYTYSFDYRYEQQDSTRYPSCKISSDLGDSPLQSMADFAFLAGLAYRGKGNITQKELDGWFDGRAVDRDDIVEEWRSRAEDEFSAVSFKLVTFPQNNNFAYVLIRGTTNNWDMLTDAQLWSAAFLMQGLRELLPLGMVFTPVMRRLIRLISKIESESIDRVSFYRDTTAFVKYIQEGVSDGLYGGVGITGHSLGGGLTLISAAQTGALGVGLSAPNAMLSRSSFDPPLTAEALDSKTFNIIPERDVVPMIDDKAQNVQSIRCETSFEDVVGCHDSTRSLCEIIYSCGSGFGTSRRPVLCECVTLFNYPEPISISTEANMTFAEFCQQASTENDTR